MRHPEGIHHSYGIQTFQVCCMSAYFHLIAEVFYGIQYAKIGIYIVNMWRRAVTYKTSRLATAMQQVSLDFGAVAVMLGNIMLKSVPAKHEMLFA